jgi:hypothetical protein
MVWTACVRAICAQAVAGRPYGRAVERAINNEVEKLVVGDQIPASPQASTKIPVCARYVRGVFSRPVCPFQLRDRGRGKGIVTTPLVVLRVLGTGPSLCALRAQRGSDDHAGGQAPVRCAAPARLHRPCAHPASAHRGDVWSRHRGAGHPAHHGQGGPQAAEQGACVGGVRGAHGAPTSPRCTDTAAFLLLSWHLSYGEVGLPDALDSVCECVVKGRRIPQFFPATVFYFCGGCIAV